MPLGRQQSTRRRGGMRCRPHSSPEDGRGAITPLHAHAPLRLRRRNKGENMCVCVCVCVCVGVCVCVCVHDCVERVMRRGLSPFNLYDALGHMFEVSAYAAMYG